MTRACLVEIPITVSWVVGKNVYNYFICKFSRYNKENLQTRPFPQYSKYFKTDTFSNKQKEL